MEGRQRNDRADLHHLDGDTVVQRHVSIITASMFTLNSKTTLERIADRTPIILGSRSEIPILLASDGVIILLSGVANKPCVYPGIKSARIARRRLWWIGSASVLSDDAALSSETARRHVCILRATHTVDMNGRL